MVSQTQERTLIEHTYIKVTLDLSYKPTLYIPLEFVLETKISSKTHVPNLQNLAFVEMEDRRDAEDAVKELNGSKIEGERISLEMSKERG